MLTTMVLTTIQTEQTMLIGQMLNKPKTSKIPLLLSTTKIKLKTSKTTKTKITKICKTIHSLLQRS
jgi:hypothetical protein